MEINVGAYIADLMYKHDRVAIPGLGAFEGNYKSTVVDYIKGEVSPPRKGIQFNPYLGVNDGILVNYIAEKHHLSPDQALEAVYAYVDEAKAAIERKEIVTFPGIGRLYKDFENKFQLLPEEKDFNPETQGLPNLNYHPLASETNTPAPLAPATQTNNYPVSPAPEPAIKQQERGAIARFADWIRANWVYLVTSFAIVALVSAIFALWDRLNENGLQPKADTTVYPEEERTNIPPAYPNEEDDPILDFPVEGNQEGSTSEEEDRANEFPKIPDALPGEELPVMEPEEDSTTDSPTARPGQKYAVIGIGVFGNEENVKRLTARLYDAGFEPYLEDLGGNTRVGAQLTYENEQEIRTALRYIQQEFEPKAFILKLGEN